MVPSYECHHGKFTSRMWTSSTTSMPLRSADGRNMPSRLEHWRCQCLWEGRWTMNYTVREGRRSTPSLANEAFCPWDPWFPGKWTYCVALLSNMQETEHQSTYQMYTSHSRMSKSRNMRTSINLTWEKRCVSVQFWTGQQSARGRTTIFEATIEPFGVVARCQVQSTFPLARRCIRFATLRRGKTYYAARCAGHGRIFLGIPDQRESLVTVLTNIRQSAKRFNMSSITTNLPKRANAQSFTSSEIMQLYPGRRKVWRV